VSAGNALFERVVTECGLSPLFARNSISRALKRAGSDPAKLTAADLVRALPEIRRALAPFIETDLDKAMARIERMTK
jgi:hypothetical protein